MKQKGRHRPFWPLPMRLPRVFERWLKRIKFPGGYEAVQLRVAEQYIQEFGELAKSSNTLVLPASVSDVGSMIALAMNVIKKKPGVPSAGSQA